MDKNKPYWLLTWNPDRWDWEDYEESIQETKSGGTYQLTWTCSSTKPCIGDEVFLIKIGKKEPRGIIAHGNVTSQSYKESQYDSTRFIDVEFDDIRNYATESILQIEKLKQTFPEQTWSPQSSGIQIKCDVDKLQKMWDELKENQIDTIMNKYVNLLKSNHNIILTGAPGTGKTYLAKQIAHAMGCTDNEIGFVQFHPSYDYTDFVEGLRPLQDESGAVGFERKDGVFKEFCVKALDNFENSQKGEIVLSQEYSVEKLYEQLLSKIESEEIINIPLKTEGKTLQVEKVSNFNNIILKSPNSTTPHTVSLKRILKLSKQYPDKKSLEEISNISEAVKRTIGGCHESAYWAVLHLMYEQNPTIQIERPIKIEKKNYVFIIDEINRGEISKIFGELFFSIDPGYRGIKGKVQTQYANMETEPNDFDEALGEKGKNLGHFFVPENVYIIGTMNDIDRSVESMDFAFRRRFAFVEVKASENTGMLDGMEWKDEAIERMNSLNDEIEKIDGLSSAYHIGASYFLKLENYNGDFEQLWKYHLEGLLREYLRGTQDVDEKMKKFENAYNLINATANDSDSDNR